MVAVTGEMWRNDVVVMSDGSHVDQPSASSGLVTGLTSTPVMYI